MIDNEYISYIYTETLYSFETKDTPKGKSESAIIIEEKSDSIPVISSTQTEEKKTPTHTIPSIKVEEKEIAAPTIPSIISEESTKPEPSSYKFLILTTSSNSEELELLHKIMQAIQVKRSEYHISEISFSKLTPISSIEETYEFQYLICFGLSYQMISNPTAVGKYKLTQQSNYQILFSDTLSELELNVQLKKLLWAEIKGLGA